MSEFLSLQGAKDLNTDAIHISAVANSVDPVTGAPIDEHVNRVGGTDYTFKGMWGALGPVVMPWTSVVGGTLTQPNQAFLHPANGNYYSWTGEYPVGGYVVAPGTDPTAVTGYVPRTDVVFRAEITPSVTEALRRSYAEAGYNLADGSFELGGTVASATDVLLYEADGHAYRWDDVFPGGGKVVPQGSTPSSTGGVGPSSWVDSSDATRAGRFPCITDYLVGDYATDNIQAWDKLIATGIKEWIVPPGVYRFSDCIKIPQGFRFNHVGLPPKLGFSTNDDKVFLAPGRKTELPGASFIFSGAGTVTVTATNRTDMFSSVRPCVLVEVGAESVVGSALSGVAVIQDMICFDSNGTPTKPGHEGKSDYDVGIYYDDVPHSLQRDVTVFGYFDKAGTVIQSRAGNDDPDYTIIDGGSTMGRKGLAILGSNTGPVQYGLSGTSAQNCGMYTLDHHSRAALTPAELASYYADADTWRSLYIDGDVDATSAEINGHYFYNCELRTRANHPLEIDHASNVQFFGGVVEVSPYGIANSDVPKFIGSANVKRGVGFYGVRMNFISLIFNEMFSDVIPVKITVSGDPLNGRFGVFGRDPDGGYSGAILGSDGNIGDASLQLTKDASNGSSGWKTTFDVSAGPLRTQYNGVNIETVTNLGNRSIAAPSGSDAVLGLLSNNNSASWYIRPQFSSEGQLQMRPGGSDGPVAMQLKIDGTINPGSDAVANVGLPSFRYNTAYFSNGVQSTSDARLKSSVRAMSNAEVSAARELVAEIGLWEWLDPSRDRTHCGLTVQRVIEVFEAHGLKPFDYAFICHDSWDDEWEDEQEDFVNEDGDVCSRPTGNRVLVRPAGDLYQFKDNELNRFLIAGAMSEINAIKSRLEAAGL